MRATFLTAVLIGLAACGTSGSPTASPSATALSDAQVLALGREVAQCFRDNGASGYPDPGLKDGQLEFARDVVPQRAREACAGVINRLPASVFGKNERRQLSNEDIAVLRQFAQCIRDHGAPWFPDPQPDGDFRVDGTPMERQIEPPPADYFAAEAQCRQFEGPGVYLKVGP
jgi:hypothetical protein